MNSLKKIKIGDILIENESNHNLGCEIIKSSEKKKLKCDCKITVSLLGIKFRFDNDYGNSMIIYNFSIGFTKDITYGKTYGNLTSGSQIVGSNTELFAGWYTETSYTNKVTSTTTVTNINSHVLFAKWKLYRVSPLWNIFDSLEFIYFGWFLSFELKILAEKAITLPSISQIGNIILSANISW